MMRTNSAWMRRRGAVVSLMAAWFLAICAQALHVQAAPASLEYAIKAAYLVKFPSFISWRGRLPSDAFNICVEGDSPFHGLLRQAAADQAVQQRHIEVRALPVAAAAPSCQVIYFSGSDDQSVSAALAAVRGRPILTVTDGQHDPAAKGIINFVIAEERVRFEVDLAAAAANGLTVSSKLLNVALSVRPDAVR